MDNMRLRSARKGICVRTGAQFSSKHRLHFAHLRKSVMRSASEEKHAQTSLGHAGRARNAQYIHNVALPASDIAEKIR